MVFGQMNEPPGNRLRVGLTGLTMAEYFRDEGRDILFFVDKHLPFSRSRALEVSAAARAHALGGGLPAHSRGRMGKLQERSPRTKVGSITSVQAIYRASRRWA